MLVFTARQRLRLIKSKSVMLDNNKVKLLILWGILCKNTDENHAMNADEIRGGRVG